MITQTKPAVGYYGLQPSNVAATVMYSYATTFSQIALISCSDYTLYCVACSSTTGFE